MPLQPARAKFCPACHKTVMREASFCPYCGAACPTAELEEKATDVIEQAEEELKDAADAEVTEAEEVTEAAEETETPEKEVSGRETETMKTEEAAPEAETSEETDTQEVVEEAEETATESEEKRNKYLRCGRLLREREPVAVFLQGKETKTHGKYLPSI